MGFLKDAAIRLRRNAWKGAQALADELFTIFNSEKGMTIDGPLTINNRDPNSPGLIINQFGPYDGSIQINQRQPVDGPQYPDPYALPEFSDLPSYSPFEPTDIPPGEGITLELTAGGNIYTINNGGPSESSDAPRVPLSQNSNAQQPDQGGGGGIPGKILSGGPGATYSVEIYPDGLLAAASTVTVTQLQIATDATIPANTWTIVTQIGDAYYMQVPVWLGDET